MRQNRSHSEMSVYIALVGIRHIPICILTPMCLFRLHSRCVRHLVNKLTSVWPYDLIIFADLEDCSKDILYMFVSAPCYFVLSSRQTCFDKHGQCAYWCHFCALSFCWRIANALLYLVARFGDILKSFRTWEASLFPQDCNFTCVAWVSTSTSTGLLDASVVLLLVLSLALLQHLFWSSRSMHYCWNRKCPFEPSTNYGLRWRCSLSCVLWSIVVLVRIWNVKNYA
jgi:hypothetical protein